jgi:hypothetical protein
VNRFLFILVVAVAACTPVADKAPALPADVIYVNGSVYTGVAGEREEAVAVRQGKIIAVGTTADMVVFEGPETRVIDLSGNTMLPGFYDNHVHADIGRGALMEWEGGLISAVPAWVREARTIAELQEALSREADRVGPSEAIVGALSREIWPNQILPTRAESTANTDFPFLRMAGRQCFASRAGPMVFAFKTSDIALMESCCIVFSGRTSGSRCKSPVATNTKSSGFSAAAILTPLAIDSSSSRSIDRL